MTDQEQLTEMFRGITERLSRAERDIDDLQLVPIPSTSTSGTYNPDSKPTSPSAYDDEFEKTTLDGIWTNINCASGTVDMLTTAAAADTYDLTMYPGMMALQPGRDNAGAAGEEAEAAILRQTINIADANAKFVCKVDMASTADTVGSVVVPSPCIGIALSGVGGLADNNFLWVALINYWAAVAPLSSAAAIGSHRIGGAAPVALGQLAGIPNPRYLMITKTGNDYSAFIGSGTGWGALVDGAAPDNTVFTFGAGVFTRLSIFTYWAPPAAEVNLFNPIGTFDFVRYFANNTPVTNA